MPKQMSSQRSSCFLVAGRFPTDALSMCVSAVDRELMEPQLVDAINAINREGYSLLVYLVESGDYTTRYSATLPVQVISSGPYSHEIPTNSAHDTNKELKQHVHGDGLTATPDVIFSVRQHRRHIRRSQLVKMHIEPSVLTLSDAQGLGYIWALDGTSSSLSLDSSHDRVLLER
ncbi:hypothetical protein F5Y18DRAFT_79417 [Xylariaceae sp. FL1019]|nr:hypothetical protein F5Y18DRAFT_79417 [Xylariaceae sp. FL1019]